MKRALVLSAVGVAMAVVVIGNVSPDFIAQMIRRWTVSLPALVLACLIVSVLLRLMLRHRASRPDPTDRETEGGGT